MCCGAMPGPSRVLGSRPSGHLARYCPAADLISLRSARAENFSALSTRSIRICTKLSADDRRVDISAIERQPEPRLFDLRGNFRLRRDSSSCVTGTALRIGSFTIARQPRQLHDVGDQAREPLALVDEIVVRAFFLFARPAGFPVSPYIRIDVSGVFVRETKFAASEYRSARRQSDTSRRIRRTSRCPGSTPPSPRSRRRCLLEVAQS